MTNICLLLSKYEKDVKLEVLIPSARTIMNNLGVLESEKITIENEKNDVEVCYCEKGIVTFG
ncbi:hypothetical protein [Clostridium estertheticum]|uniref:Uncharacterized protein n=1 Tax=Clostridium estertheticum TaxID=238834 RepID=A0A7Y3SUU1_9CLOT|nr:hypothetical protein [Clostridium estertheticum]MBU3183629.1 hypothetical protein [Clostridium estertheticum]MBW9169905.1 hypothetical protein [Clostridium estertheticum]NNU75776.1 hypothetical protein [Clostridium estertheticum]WBL46464.1 hypothetical protein LOR37_17570 [Clostridium estertheticum]